MQSASQRKGPRQSPFQRGPNAGEEGLETRPRLFDQLVAHFNTLIASLLRTVPPTRLRT
jgi:hypothetical protein